MVVETVRLDYRGVNYYGLLEGFFPRHIGSEEYWNTLRTGTSTRAQRRSQTPTSLPLRFGTTDSHS